MNVLSAMAGITDGEYCKKFTKQGIDIITIGGYNADLKSFQAGIKTKSKGRKEFLTCTHHLPEKLYEQSEIIRNYNPKWKGVISANLRATSANAFDCLDNLKGIHIIELNAHCRQDAIVTAGCGQALLKKQDILSDILEKITKFKTKTSVKIRCNVPEVNTLEIVNLLSSYPIDYLHVDATNPNIFDKADYDALSKIHKKCDIHIIGNNNVTCYDDYIHMINSGADSVSVARASLNGNIEHIFKKG